MAKDILADPRVRERLDVGSLDFHQKALLRQLLDENALEEAGWGGLDDFLDSVERLDVTHARQLASILFSAPPEHGLSFDFVDAEEDGYTIYELSIRSRVLDCWLTCADDAKFVDPERLRRVAGDGPKAGTPLRLALKMYESLDSTYLDVLRAFGKLERLAAKE